MLGIYQEWVRVFRLRISIRVRLRVTGIVRHNIAVMVRVGVKHFEHQVKPVQFNQ
jgi:hypothetical protein